MKLPLLSELLAYDNQSVIQYCCHHNNLSCEQAQLLFNDLLAWMWISAYRQKKGHLSYLFGPLLPLDQIWHGFILHTRDYVNFCDRFFGEYFHHHVEPIGFEHTLHNEELADFLNDCFDHLGNHWLTRNFSAEIDAYQEF
jgi:hypothetical protein